MSPERRREFTSTAAVRTCHRDQRRVPKLKTELFAEVGATAQESPLSGVRIWSTHLESMSPADLEELSALLDSTEHARAARFHFERDRRHYLASHGLLRRLLGAALKQPPSALVFEYGLHGKPVIANDGQSRMLHFNLSHSSGWAMFALAWDREVGIDLESGSRLEHDDNSLSDLAGRILSTRELEIWRALPDAAERRGAFLRAWTRKEAYAKATGQGVSHQLDRIEVALDASAPKSSLTLRSAHAQGLIRDWTLHDLSAPKGFAAALAVGQKLKPNE